MKLCLYKWNMYPNNVHGCKDSDKQFECCGTCKLSFHDCPVALVPNITLCIWENWVNFLPQVII